ncbi:putative membrane protein [Thermanaerovibrio velox DSM 12556]|uniref:Putative membrane protein n=1 Tax=Thermanaerovibrio velox DSM 12556 TaxID=926567 RepID=H0UQN0_9BACT|nr:DMT family transporter [Thermanaerovibrio velox]EHM10794.1 putative membrane protein [Thermanaerovibrio velox DSM 12556]
MTLLGLFLGLVTACLWALSPILLKVGMRGVRREDINPMRSFGFLGGMTLIALASRSGGFVPSTLWAVPLVVVNVYLGNVLGDYLYFGAIKELGVSRAVAVGSSYPLMVMIVSSLWLGERPSIWHAGATLAIVAGLALLRMERSREEAEAYPLKGYVKALSASLCWGVSIPITKWLVTSGGFSPVGANWWRSLALFVIAWGMWFLGPGKQRSRRAALLKIPLKTWLVLNASGAVGLALGGYTFAVALRICPASLITPITASSPLITALAAVWFMKERLARHQWIGVGMVVLGSGVIGIL